MLAEPGGYYQHFKKRSDGKPNIYYVLAIALDCLSDYRQVVIYFNLCQPHKLLVREKSNFEEMVNEHRFTRVPSPDDHFEKHSE